MQKEGNQEAYKLRCKNIKYKVNKEKDTVTALETVVVPSPFSFFSHWPTYFSTIGVAKVSKEAGEKFYCLHHKNLAQVLSIYHSHQTILLYQIFALYYFYIFLFYQI